MHEPGAHWQRLGVGALSYEDERGGSLRHALKDLVGTTDEMFIHPNLREARPLMVVGGPRCGTRFVAGALNCSPTILVQGEIPARAMEKAVRFLSETTDYFATVPKWAASWDQNRCALLYALWTSMTKGKPRAVSATVTWFGHKTPGHDVYWEFYRDFFGDLTPKYVFCMRNFVEHYLSVTSMNERYTIDAVAQRYRASVARYAEMKAALGDNVSLFLLDDLDHGGLDYIRETLFERLGIEVDNRTLSSIDPSRPANSTEGAGRLRRKELTADERVFLDENGDLLQALQALRAARPLGGNSDSTPSRNSFDVRPQRWNHLLARAVSRLQSTWRA